MKRIKSILLTITVCLGYFILGRFIYFCTEYDTVYISYTCYKPQVPYNHERVDRVLKNGDVNSYIEIVDSIKSDSNQPYPTYLYYSLVMADEYNYAPAFYDVYAALTDKNGVDSLDGETKELAMRYLKAAVERGDGRAVKEFQKIRQHSMEKLK